MLFLRAIPLVGSDLIALRFMFFLRKIKKKQAFRRGQSANLVFFGQILAKQGRDEKHRFFFGKPLVEND